jgi:hypothetical protein
MLAEQTLNNTRDPFRNGLRVRVGH